MADLFPGRLGLGAANLGNLYREFSEDEAWTILETASESGIRYFDTAPHYGLGLSERRLGAFLATKPRDEFVVSTKLGRLLRPNPGGSEHLDLEKNSCATRGWFRCDDERHRQPPARIQEVNGAHRH